MAISEKVLKQIIKEELQKVLLNEVGMPTMVAAAAGYARNREAERERERQKEKERSERWKSAASQTAADNKNRELKPWEIEAKKEFARKEYEREEYEIKEKSTVNYLYDVFKEIEEEHSLEELASIYFRSYKDKMHSFDNSTVGPEFKKELIDTFKKHECYETDPDRYDHSFDSPKCRPIPEDLKDAIFDIIKKFSPRRAQKGFIGSMARKFSASSKDPFKAISFTSQTKE